MEIKIDYESRPGLQIIPEIIKGQLVWVRGFNGIGKTLLEIQKIMGHKRFTSTMQYINYEKQIYARSDEWISRQASTPEDRKRLIEKGFEFVEAADGISYYRKRKD